MIESVIKDIKIATRNIFYIFNRIEESINIMRKVNDLQIFFKAQIKLLVMKNTSETKTTLDVTDSRLTGLSMNVKTKMDTIQNETEKTEKKEKTVIISLTYMKLEFHKGWEL